MLTLKIVLVAFPVWSCLPGFPSNCHTRSHIYFSWAGFIAPTRHGMQLTFTSHFLVFVLLFWSLIQAEHWILQWLGFCFSFFFSKLLTSSCCSLIFFQATLVLLWRYLLKYKEMSTWPEMLAFYFWLLHNICHQQKLIAGSKKVK